MNNVILPDDRRHLGARLSVLQWIVAGTFGVLAVSFWVFQVAQHEKFKEMADNNHIRRIPLPAPRGVLFDRNGKILVENRNTFNIGLVREQTRNLDETLQTLAEVTGIEEAQLRETLSRRRREPSYRPIVLVENASEEQVIAVRAREWELPGIVYQEVPARQYPASDLAAHLFGYVSEINETQLARTEYAGVEPGTLVGQAGIEQSYNKLLMGADGDRLVVVNSLGREINPVENGERPAREGTALQLTIDADVQRSIEDAFEASGFNGAAVVLDPRNGEVLGFSSRPAYDPNAFAGGVDRATWASLNTDELKPLQNRAVQGRYSPGSTFKMAVGLAGLEEGIITPDFRVHCGGGQTFYGRFFKCWKKGGHGSLDLRHAIEQSCDVYFYTVGNMLGVDRINKWATLFGLGVRSNIDLPSEVQGLVPSTAWKAQYTKEKKWYAGETISVAIGQGQVSVTPVSMAVYVATLANGGVRVTPHLVKAADDGTGWKPAATPPPQSTVEVTPEKLQAIRDGMWMVVNAGGTGGRARIVGHDVCGKTGTAQVISNTGRTAARTNRDLRDHGWFVFFAPRDNPEIAGVVFLEHGIHGPNAASLAHHILDTYFAKHDGKPLPPAPTHDDLRLDYKDPFARGGTALAGGQD
ncbi:MAG TPA: penicillin-binding protein 2 [Vicinamibacterales bacterium]|jgi:penicillin-binding protein 2|nr:penicillin-binding protein 2 [Vicinamibacterales bacterium]